MSCRFLLWREGGGAGGLVFEGRREEGGRGTDLAGFVLCDFVLCVLFAIFTLAVGAAGFGYVDLWADFALAFDLNVVLFLLFLRSASPLNTMSC